MKQDGVRTQVAVRVDHSLAQGSRPFVDGIGHREIVGNQRIGQKQKIARHRKASNRMPHGFSPLYWMLLEV
jgi:hypothetical protein